MLRLLSRLLIGFVILTSPAFAAKRWALSPVVIVEGTRVLKVGTIVDPGRPCDPDCTPYHYAAVVSGRDWAIAQVTGMDFSALDADPEIITLADLKTQDESETIEKQPSAKKVKMNNFLTAKGVDISDMDSRTTLRDMILKAMRVHQPEMNLSTMQNLYIRDVEEEGKEEEEEGKSNRGYLPDDRALAALDGILYAQATTLIVHDQFTSAANANLDAHTATPVGQQWVLEQNTSTTTGLVDATLDVLTASGPQDDVFWIYTSRPNPSGTSYNVQATMTTRSGASNSVSPFHLVGYMTDTSNLYACSVFRETSTTDKRTYKKVAGTSTEIANFDSDTVNGDVIRCEFSPGSQKFYRNDVLQISTTDSSLTSAGRAGIAFGGVFVSTNDLRPWEVDEFKVTEISGRRKMFIGGKNEVHITASLFPVIR